jgi:signal transduction histidine kinase
VYDTRGALVATNVHPPFDAPTSIEQHQTATGLAQRGGARVVSQIRRGDTVLGFVVFEPAPPRPPLWGVAMDLLIISTWISAVGLLVWRTLVRPLQRIANAAEAFGRGNMLARTGVVRRDEIGKVARAFDEMSERIALSREAERELLAGLSHELRTPLARIRVALDLADEGDAETARTSLADVAEELTEIETLMASIFSTTRLALAAAGRDHQPVPLQRTQVDLPTLVERAVARLRAQHPQRPYALETIAGPAGRWIYADAILIRRAVENVLDNAHKYSPAGTPVTIAISQREGAFRIAITDQGFGICPADLPRVFTPFFRADRSRTRATGGVGLGLALAKRVVDAHDGDISVSSQVDVGTTVTFTLPLADAPRDLERP